MLLEIIEQHVIDAGCRFSADSVPEYIVFDKQNMAKDFIEVLEEGLRKSRTEVISKEEFKKEQEKEVKELSKKAEEFIKEEENSEENIAKIKEEKLTKIKSNMGKLNMTSLQGIIAKHKVTNLGDASIIPMECLDEILALI